MSKGVLNHARCLLAVIAASLLLAGLLIGPLQPATQAAAANGLVGVWSTSVFGENLLPELGNGANLIGHWKITLTDAMTYTLAREDIGVAVEGTYKIDGNHVSFTDTGGLQSCATPQAGSVNAEDAATGIYTWKRSGDTLTLKRSSDRCGLRSVLFTAQPLVPYVACTTASYPLGNTVQIVNQTPVPTEAATPVASPASGAVSPRATPQIGLGIPGADEPLGKPVNVTDAVDTVLSQLTACWATGDPARVLPLFSETFLKDLISLGPPGTSINDVGQVFQELMSTPMSWKRATKVTANGPLKASTVAAMTVDGKTTYQKLDFVLEKGQWKLADLGTATSKPKS